MSEALEGVCEALSLRLADGPETRLVAQKIIELAQRGVRDVAALQTMTLANSSTSGASGSPMSFDYDAPAELFLAKRTKSSRENYRRFATAAEAIRYAVETLRTPKAYGAWLEVGERFNSSEIQRLYEAADYPLRKPE
jgi:hypothetical protein